MRKASRNRLARAAVNEYLRQHAEEEFVPLYTLSAIADRAAGKELHRSLFNYVELLPQGSRATWVKETGCFSARNPYYCRATTSGLHEYGGPLGVFDVGVDLGPKSLLER